MERAQRCENDLWDIMRKYGHDIHVRSTFRQYGYFELESARLYEPVRLQSHGSHSNHWRQPLDPLWTADDGREVRRFYDDHVAINKQQWQKNCEYVDRLLKYVFEEIQDQAQVNRYLQLHHFVRQGSSREGLKISAADEFDVVLPFTFMGIDTEIEEAPDAALPAGVAEICIRPYSNTDGINPGGLIAYKNGKRYVSTQVLHDTLFKSLVDKALQKIRQNSGRLGSAPFEINRRSGSPAIALGITIKEPNGDIFISVDVVPGFEVIGKSAKHRKFLVTRWLPETKNRTLMRPYQSPDTSWRISHSHYEMHVFETWCEGENARQLVTAFRILKGIKESDVLRNPSSQLASVLKSYHLKNILLFALLYLTQLNKKHINSVAEALSYLVAMVRICLQRKSLPQFFTSNFGLWKFFPDETFHEEDPSLRVNLFAERIDSVGQITRDFNRAVSGFGHDEHIYQDFMQLFEDHVCIQ